MSDHEYLNLVETAPADERVLGLVLSGSRSFEVLATPSSDWDARLVVSLETPVTSRGQRISAGAGSRDASGVALRPADP